MKALHLGIIFLSLVGAGAALVMQKWDVFFPSLNAALGWFFVYQNDKRNEY